MEDIRRAIESSELGLNPMTEGKQIRLNIPPLSGERRQQLVNRTKKMAEETKVVLRNARRDANKHADTLTKQEGKQYPEDEVKTLKDEIQELLKKYEAEIDQAIDAKSKEIMEI
jgi:ribosome recycling factor